MVDTYLQRDVMAETHLAIALYLATYYDENQCGAKFKQAHHQNKDF